MVRILFLFFFQYQDNKTKINETRISCRILLYFDWMCSANHQILIILNWTQISCIFGSFRLFSVIFHDLEPWLKSISCPFCDLHVKLDSLHLIFGFKLFRFRRRNGKNWNNVIKITCGTRYTGYYVIVYKWKRYNFMLEKHKFVFFCPTHSPRIEYIYINCSNVCILCYGYLVSTLGTCSMLFVINRHKMCCTLFRSSNLNNQCFAHSHQSQLDDGSIKINNI